MPTLWLFDIEPHEQRYTSEWRTYLPKQLRDAIRNGTGKSWVLQEVTGIATTGDTTAGGFLNFAETNSYKAAQIARFATVVQEGAVEHGDRVLFADAWHPGVIQCRYMADLFDIDLSIDVMWHAGSYDPWDLLGQKVSNKAWSFAFERAVFAAADRSYFATHYHCSIFLGTLTPDHPERAEVVGWPMEYLPDLLAGRATSSPKDTILFPHRLTPEKQPEIMRLLEPMLSEFRVCFAMEQQLSKEEYHAELARSVAVFSANLQETLGICPYEGLLCGAVPIVPKRLSYGEMYPVLPYPSAWTETLQAAKANATKLVDHIHRQIDEHNIHSLAGIAEWVGNGYFDGRKLYDSVLR
jgi:hypothetical protein